MGDRGRRRRDDLVRLHPGQKVLFQDPSTYEPFVDRKREVVRRGRAITEYQLDFSGTDGPLRPVDWVPEQELESIYITPPFEKGHIVEWTDPRLHRGKITAGHDPNYFVQFYNANNRPGAILNVNRSLIRPI